ncbi:GDP/GTP exchange factor for ARF, partial [Linderina pennispora]
MDEFNSRRSFGKAGASIGMAAFGARDDDSEDDAYAVSRIMMLESFLLLREAINGVSDPRTMDPQQLFDPFLLVIRDAETTGPITRCTLVSVQRFLAHGIIDFGRSAAAPVFLELARAVTQCRFEATDAASDEAVLMQILNVLSAIVLSPGGHHLTDVVVCEIMETVLSMSCQMRLSEMLRKAAESTLFTLVTFVFGKLNTMLGDINGQEGKGEESRAEAEDLAMIMPSASAMLVNTDRTKQRVDGSSNPPATSAPVSIHEPENEDENGNEGAEDPVARADSAPDLTAAAEELALTSFSLPAIRELYRVLVTLVNPRDLQYTDSMRLLALNTLQVAFQTAGGAMATFATLRELTLDDLSHYLLLVLQRDQSVLIAPALRVLFLLFASHRRDTKGHLELFLCQTFGRIMSPPVIERQGSRANLRNGGTATPGSGRATPKLGAGPQRRTAKARVVAESKREDDVGLGISETASKQPHTEKTHRRSSVSTFSASEVQPPAPALPPMSPLLENEYPLSFDQEVELYKETSLRKGVRGRIAIHETRRQLLEGLHHLLTGDESLITDLWVNYDCDMQRGNMFDFLISFVTQRAVPWPESPDDSEDEAFLDIMLFFLIRIANRAGVKPPHGKWAQLLGLPAGADEGSGKPADIQGAYREQTACYESAADIPLSMAQLQDRKKHKETMSRAAQLFNEKPKDGIAYLQKVGVLPPDNSTELSQQLARFLRETPTLDKKLLGEFLAKPSNLEVLQSYIQLFDFSGRRLDEALRSMLGTFRLPGESQQIERIMETFAAAYSASDPADVANKDAGFILSYAVIMLNVDQHSVKVKNRMRFEDFARNLRGVNDGQDFRTGFLTDVYNAIRDREIIFPEEHEGEAGFDYAWREISSDDSTVGPWVTTRGRTAQYDRGVLAATWPRLLRALARILSHFSSDHTLRLALSGLHALVASAAHYRLGACVDESLRLMAQLTGLLDPSLHSDLMAPQVLTQANGRFAIVDPESPASAIGTIAEGFVGSEQVARLREQEDKDWQLTRVALEFGKDYRGQIALVSLFEFAALWPTEIGEQGWADILEIERIVIDADLLPHDLLGIGDLLVDNMWVPRISTVLARDAAKERMRARQSSRAGAHQAAQPTGGLFSALTSFLGGAGPNDQAQTMGPRRELRWRWREQPEVLVELVRRSKLAVQATAVDRLVDFSGISESSLPALLSAMSDLFPQPLPTPPGTPIDDTAKPGGEKPAAAGSPGRNDPTGGAVADEIEINYSPASVFFFEAVVALVEKSPARAPLVWSCIEQSLQRTLEASDTLYHFSLERLVSGLLRMAISALDLSTKQEANGTPLMDVVERILRCIGLLRDAQDATFDSVVSELVTGIAKLVDIDGRALIAGATSWEIVRQLIKRVARANSSTSDINRQALSVLVEIVILVRSGAVELSVYFADVLDILSAFMPADRELISSMAAKPSGETSQQLSAADVAMKLVALLYDMQETARTQPKSTNAAMSPSMAASPPMASASHQHAFGEHSVTSHASVLPLGRTPGKTTPIAMWIAAMNSMAAYACTAHRDIRHLACTNLQRAISAHSDPDAAWAAATFHRILLPLMDTLLRPDLLADQAMEDTHARCISMLAMYFLHNAAGLQQLAGTEGAAPGSPRSTAEHAVDQGTGSEAAMPPLDQVWLRLVGVLATYIHTSNLASSRLSPRGDSTIQASVTTQPGPRRGHLGVLAELAEENIKNCVLVLDTMGLFGTDRESSPLWTASWDRLDKVSPQLKAHIFPSVADNTEQVTLANNAQAAETGQEPLSTEGAMPECPAPLPDQLPASDAGNPAPDQVSDQTAHAATRQEESAEKTEPKPAP